MNTEKQRYRLLEGMDPRTLTDMIQGTPELLELLKAVGNAHIWHETNHGGPLDITFNGYTIRKEQR